MAVKKRLMVNRKQEAALKLKKNAVNMKAKNKTGKAMDARLKINAIARKKTLSTLKASGDARDVLAHKMKQVGDARAILEKSRNLKKGINEIKTTKKGGIQIVTKTNGKLQLTTKKKVAQQTKKTPTTATKNVQSAKVTKIGKNLTKSVGPGGTVSFSTKPKPSALSTPSARNNTSAPRRPAKSAPRTASRPMSRAERRDGNFIPNMLGHPVISFFYRGTDECTCGSIDYQTYSKARCPFKISPTSSALSIKVKITHWQRIR